MNASCVRCGCGRRHARWCSGWGDRHLKLVGEQLRLKDWRQQCRFRRLRRCRGPDRVDRSHGVGGGDFRFPVLGDRKVILKFSPTPGRFAISPSGPIPDRSSSAADPIAPAHSITSSRARRIVPPQSIPVARPFSTTIRSAWVRVSSRGRRVAWGAVHKRRADDDRNPRR